MKHFGNMRTKSRDNSDDSEDQNDDDDDDEGWVLTETLQVKEMAFDEDVYNAAMYSFIHDTTELVTRTKKDDLHYWANLERLVFSAFSLLINNIIQLTLLWQSYLHFVLPQVTLVQSAYAGYHAECFDLGTPVRNETKFAVWPDEKKELLCEIVFAARRDFLYIILVLWWITLVNEVRRCERIAFRRIRMIPTCTELDEQFHIDENKIERVSALTRKTRMLLLIIIVLPKMLISMVLLGIGTLWLTATTSYSELLLNALALEFIVQVDELIFDAIFAESLKEHIQNARLVFPVSSADLKWRGIASGVKRSLGWWLAVLVFVRLYIYYGQHLPYISVLPGYARDIDCADYWSAKTMEPCRTTAFFGGDDCFPFGYYKSDEMESHMNISLAMGRDHF